MAWTSPRTWVAGEKPTAATMNLHIKDQFNAIVKSVANVAALPGTGDYAGQRVYVEDLDVVAWWDQKTTAWQGYAKTYTPAVSGTAGENVANTTYLIEPSGKVEVSFSIILTAGATATFNMDLPAGITFHADETTPSTKALGIANLRDDTAANNRQIGMVCVASSSAVLFTYNVSTTTTQNAGSGGGATPWTWATGDSISGTFRFRRSGS